MAKDREDSLYWRISKTLALLQYEVAASHVRHGGAAVVLTNRRPWGRVAIEQEFSDEVGAHLTERSTKVEP